MPNIDSYDVARDDIRSMIGISEADFDLFRRHRDFFLSHAEALVGYIASILSNHPPTQAVFDEGRGDLGQLGARITAWLVEVLDGHDRPDFWIRHYLIAIEHIRRRIPNRHMIALATRIRELLLPLMVDKLGASEGIELFLAFQRFLDIVVALTTTLVDLGQERCMESATGMSPALLMRLQDTAIDEIAAELRQAEF